MRAPRLLDRLLSVSHPGHLLQASLAAISVTHFGAVTCDDTITQKGRSLYVQALHYLQGALHSPELSEVEDALTCVTVLAMYEVRSSLLADFKQDV